MNEIQGQFGIRAQEQLLFSKAFGQFSFDLIK